MSKKTLKLQNKKYFNSGIYNRPFYDEQFIREDSPQLAEARLVKGPSEWRVENEKVRYLEYWDPLSEEYEEASSLRYNRSRFYNHPMLHKTFYEPMIFDKKIAIECGLIPFYYKKTQCTELEPIVSLVALIGDESELKVRLDAYQVLTHGTIDQKSVFFFNKSHYIEVLGAAIVAKMEIVKNLQSANNYFNSGVYDRPFYEKEYIYYYPQHGMRRNANGIYYNKDLLAEMWKEGGKTQEELDKKVSDRFWHNLELWWIYYQPQVFDEKIALECGLTPFAYPNPQCEDDWLDIQLLALSGDFDEFKPRLDAYQVLCDGTIDEQSLFFYDKEAFEKVMGGAIVAKMEMILNIFYIKHKDIYLFDDDNNYISEGVNYNKELLTKIWKETENLKGTENEIDTTVTNLFWKNLWRPVYYEPLIFEEETALLCGLTPFTYNGMNLLGQGEYAKNLPPRLMQHQANLNPRLDAYEFLTRGTIGKFYN